MTPTPDTATPRSPRHRRGGAARALNRSWREAVIPLGPGDTAAVPVLRAITRRVLTGWQIATDRVDDIELAVSELTANALIHTRGPVRVRLAHRRGTLRLDVADTSTHRPEPADADLGEDLENGRGLGIVAALADRMHTEPHSDGRAVGKVTIAEFDVAG